MNTATEHLSLTQLCFNQKALLQAKARVSALDHKDGSQSLLGRERLHNFHRRPRGCVRISRLFTVQKQTDSGEQTGSPRSRGIHRLTELIRENVLWISA